MLFIFEWLFHLEPPPIEFLSTLLSPFEEFEGLVECRSFYEKFINFTVCGTSLVVNPLIRNCFRPHGISKLLMSVCSSASVLLETKAASIMFLQAPHKVNLCQKFSFSMALVACLWSFLFMRNLVGENRLTLKDMNQSYASSIVSLKDSHWLGTFRDRMMNFCIQLWNFLVCLLG